MRAPSFYSCLMYQSEDPALSSELTVAFVRGAQGMFLENTSLIHAVAVTCVFLCSANPALLAKRSLLQALCRFSSQGIHFSQWTIAYDLENQPTARQQFDASA